MTKPSRTILRLFDSTTQTQICLLTALTLIMLKKSIPKPLTIIPRLLSSSIRKVIYLRLQRGRAYYMAGDDYNAIRDFTGIIEVDNKNGDAFYERAKAYSFLKMYDQAISDYGEAIRLKPGEWLPWLFRAEVFSKKGDSQRAIADLTD